MFVVKLPPFINPISGQIGRPSPDIFKMALVRINLDINPIYDGLERSCPRVSKNVSYVDVRLVQTGLDLILSYGGGGLNKNLVKPWA